MIDAERAALEADGIRKLSALIRYWTRVEPAEDLQAFAAQAAEALWLEERFSKIALK